MPASIQIPSIFTAKDKFSSVVAKMGGAVKNFSKQSVAAVNRLDAKVSSVFRSIGTMGQVLLGLSVGTLFASAIDDLKNYEDGIASFRTIVSDLSDKEFAHYTKAVNDVAKETKKSSIDVVMSFEKIAGLNAKFAETSDGISLVSKAAITLSRASKDELGTSAENLVGIMNQFSLEANQADRAINVLAAGQAVGAASITQTSEAFKNFGSVASGSNITLEESVALIQTLGKFSVFGAEAGTKLRGSTLQLQKAGFGYASGQFNINDALAEASAKMAKLSTAKKKDAFLTKTFGAENVSTGRILLANIDTFKDFTKGVTGTSEAQKAASINSDTLRTKIDEMKASFTNYLTTNDNTVTGLNLAKDAFGWVAENIDKVVMGVLVLLGAFVGLKAIVALTTAVSFLYSVALGVNAASVGAMSLAMKNNVVAQTAFKIAMGIGTAVTWLATAATTAFGIALNLGLWPILAIIAAIVAVILVIKNWSKITDWFGEKWAQFTNWISELWDKVVNFFKEFDFKAMFKSIGQSIMKFMFAPMKGLLTLLSKLPGKIGELASMGLEKIGEFTGEVDVNSDDKEPLPSTSQASNESVKETIKNSKIRIDVKDKGGNVDKVTQDGDDKKIPVNTSDTVGAF